MARVRRTRITRTYYPKVEVTQALAGVLTLTLSGMTGPSGTGRQHEFLAGMDEYQVQYLLRELRKAVEEVKRRRDSMSADTLRAFNS